MLPQPQASPLIAGSVLPIKKAEELLQTLPAVMAVRIIASETGAVDEIHVLTTSEATPKQLRRLATNPQDLMRFQATGQLPRGTKPTGPLIELLNAIGGRDRCNIRGVVVDERLGYMGTRRFETAQQAFLWVRPSDEVFGSFPADSWRIKDFVRPLTLEDLQECCTTFPDGILNGYPRLRRPASRRPAPR